MSLRKVADASIPWRTVKNHFGNGGREVFPIFRLAGLNQDGVAMRRAGEVQRRISDLCAHHSIEAGRFDR